MTARVRTVLAATALSVLGGLTAPAVAAPAASAQPTGAAAAPAVVVCDAAVALGSTSECDLAAGDSARYTVSVLSPDTLRYRVAVPSGQTARTMTLLDDVGASVCTDSGFVVAECAVPAGTFVLEVMVGLSDPNRCSPRSTACSPRPAPRRST